MNIHIISIFPEIFDSFIQTSLISKSIKKKILKFHFVNPRDFCLDKHHQVDDEIYGGGTGMLMKAKPLIDSIESIIKNYKLGIMNEKKIKKFKTQNSTFKIILLSPSKEIFNQKLAHSLSDIQNLIFVCGRYEGIDYRFEQYLTKKYKKNFSKISIGQFITLGGELPAMTMIESIVRLIPGVIQKPASRQDESYSIENKMKNLEYPQYTRPEKVYNMQVPEILLSGYSKKIEERKKKNSKHLK